MTTEIPTPSGTREYILCFSVFLVLACLRCNRCDVCCLLHVNICLQTAHWYYTHTHTHDSFIVSYLHTILKTNAFLRSTDASKKLRWWASLCLLLALVPILWLYLIWYPMTCMEQIKAAEIEQNKHVQNRLCTSSGNSSSNSSGSDFVEKSSENSVVTSGSHNIL